MFAVWLIYEQVCIAACDCGRVDIAEVSVVIALFMTPLSRFIALVVLLQEATDALRKQFPKSSRVRKLFGFRNEACGKYVIYSGYVVFTVIIYHCN